jgi:chemotaxis protein histidine kinase CheA
MTPSEAAKLLDLPVDATPEQLEARFLELRTRLEDKIAKAPTPGLKAKYRETLEQVTAAFESLTLAADSSALPVVRKAVAGGVDPGPKTPPLSPGSPPPATPPNLGKKKSSPEFLVVALVAVAVLGAGGWFILKTRAEAAEKARLEAVAKDEQARQAEAARVVAEQARRDADAKRAAEEAEKVRLAAEEKARQEKQAQQAAAIRASLAELKIAWEATELDARAAERRTSEMRSDLRNVNTASPEGRRAQAELAAQQEFAGWLGDQLPRHPARIARVQAEELLSARQLDEAAAALQKAADAQHRLDSEIAATRKSLFTLTAPVTIVVPAEAAWELVDAYAQKTTGRGPAVVPDRPFGSLTLRATLTTFAPKETSTTLYRGKEAIMEIGFVPPQITLNTHPQGATVLLNGQPHTKTPAAFTLAGPGTTKVEFQLEGYEPVTFEENLAEGAVADWYALLRNDKSGMIGFAYEWNAQGEVAVTQIAPKSPALAAGLTPGTVVAAIKHDDQFVALAGVHGFEFVKMLAGNPGQVATLRVRAPGSSELREISITRISLKELEERNRPIAEVHLLRPPRWNGGAVPMNIVIRGQKYSLRQKEQVVLRLPPGKFDFEAGWWSGMGPCSIEVTDGINYFDCDSSSGMPKPVRLDPAAGAALAASYKVEAELDLK